MFSILWMKEQLNSNQNFNWKILSQWTTHEEYKNVSNPIEFYNSTMWSKPQQAYYLFNKVNRYNDWNGLCLNSY